jgi:TolB-like protein
MKDPSPLSPLESSHQPPEVPLDSWKEIARYLKRDVSTVQRWEKREGMPVYRHAHDKRGSVYAYSSELDAWLQGRKPLLEEEEKEYRAETPEEADADRGPNGTAWAHRWLAVCGITLLVLVAVTYVTTRSRAGGATRSKIKSLAVLPLKNLSGDPAQDYFADGMTEAIIGRLSAIRGLRVISRTSAMQFKDTQLSVPQIAKTLGVDAMVEGSVIRQGGRVRVHAQLIRGATDEHFWSETYDRDLGDALSLESEVAQAIAGRVEVTVTGVERARLVAARPVSPKVYESYLKGRFTNNNTRAGEEKRISYFEEAIKEDPTFAPAYVGLAYAYDELGSPGIGGAPPGAVRPIVISAASKALELDPEIPEAHVLLAIAYQERWQWSDSEREFKRALDLNPNDAGTHLVFGR